MTSADFNAVTGFQICFNGTADSSCSAVGHRDLEKPKAYDLSSVAGQTGGCESKKRAPSVGCGIL